MKVLPIGITASLLLVTIPVHAQEYEGCFMISNSGRLINLSAVCVNQPAAIVTPASTSVPAQPTSTQPREDLRAIAYADAYCRARRDGYSGDIARQRGVVAMQNSSLYQHDGDVDAVLADTPSDEIIRDALDKVQTLCPESAN